MVISLYRLLFCDNKNSIGREPVLKKIERGTDSKYYYFRTLKLTRPAV
jgi:hypothetical protein